MSKKKKKRKIPNTSDELKFRIQNSIRPNKVETPKTIYDRKKEKFIYKRKDEK